MLKIQATFVFSLFMLLAAQEAEAQGTCDVVSCAGQGNCVIVDGRPACSCNPGYTTDSTGLNCIPLGSGQTAPAVEIRRSTLHGFYTWLLGVIFIPTGTIMAVGGLFHIASMEIAGIPLTVIGFSMLTAGIIQTVVGGVLLRRDRRRRLSGTATVAPSIAPTSEGGFTLGLSGSFF